MNPEERAWFGQPELPTTEHSLSELPVRKPETPQFTFNRTSQPDVFSQYGVPKEEDPDLRIPSHTPEEQYGAW